MEYSHQEAIQQINESPEETIAEDLWEMELHVINARE
jgi:hypothetical protein